MHNLGPASGNMADRCTKLNNNGEFAMNDKALVSEEMVRQAIFYCPDELSTPAKHRWMANE